MILTSRNTNCHKSKQRSHMGFFETEYIPTDQTPEYKIKSGFPYFPHKQKKCKSQQHVYFEHAPFIKCT